MFAITLLCVGKLKEPFYQAACREYEKRLSGYCSCRVIELPEGRSREQEAEAIRAKIPKERGCASLRRRERSVPPSNWPGRCAR